MPNDFRDVRRALRDLAGALAGLTQRINRVAFNLDKLEARTRRVGVTVDNLAASAVTTVDITWTEPYADTSYAVIPTLICGPAALPVLRCGLQPNSKTVTGCTIQISNTSASVIATVGVDVLCLRDAT